jgi:hypothetical protein
MNFAAISSVPPIQHHAYLVDDPRDGTVSTIEDPVGWRRMISCFASS